MSQERGAGGDLGVRGDSGQKCSWLLVARRRVLNAPPKQLISECDARTRGIPAGGP